MTELTRSRGKDSAKEKWDIFYDDVCVGSIGQRAGVPNHVDHWEWKCGFYPGCQPGQHTSGSASTFKEARTGFDAAWQALLPTRAEADFQAWRDQHDWTEEKNRPFDRGERIDPHWRPA